MHQQCSSIEGVVVYTKGLADHSIAQPTLCISVWLPLSNIKVIQHRDFCLFAHV